MPQSRSYVKWESEVVSVEETDLRTSHLSFSPKLFSLFPTVSDPIRKGYFLHISLAGFRSVSYF